LYFHGVQLALTDAPGLTLVFSQMYVLTLWPISYLIC